MFSNKLIWSIVIVCFLLIFIKYLGFFELFNRKEPFTNKDVEKNALAQLNLVYSSNGGYPTDGIGPEIYVNKHVNKWSEPIIKEFIRPEIKRLMLLIPKDQLKKPNSDLNFSIILIIKLLRFILE